MLELIKKIDKVFTAYPFFGSRRIAAFLRRDKIVVGCHRVRRFAARVGLEAIYRCQHPQHLVYLYLLRNMPITRTNQVWCSDITFISVRGDFLYLSAVMDWATRKVLGWRPSNTIHLRKAAKPFEKMGPLHIPISPPIATDNGVSSRP